MPLQELRLATRTLVRYRLYSLVVILTLALGMGGNIAFFSLIYDVVYKPLPYPQPDRIAYFHWQTEGGTLHASSVDKFFLWRDNSTLFDHVAVYEIKSAGGTLRSDHATAYVETLGVSSAFSEVLGISLQRGRDFDTEDMDPGAPRTAIISHGLWQNALGGGEDILGSGVTLGGELYTIIGILPKDFWFPGSVDVLLPLQLAYGESQDTNIYSMIGSLDDQANLHRAEEEGIALFQRLQTFSASAEEERAVSLGTYKEHLVGDIRQELLLLFTAGLLVFLICCVNLSNVVMARANFLRLQTTLRLALGGNWRHVFRDTLAENSLLAALGTLFGWLLARVLIPSMMALSPEGLPRATQIRLGFAEALFAGLFALLALVLISLAPTLRVTRAEQIASRLRSLSGGHTAAAGRGSRRFGQVLVVGQLALAVPILCASLVLVENLRQLKNIDSGFDVEEVVTIKIPLSAEKYQTTVATSRFSRDLIRSFAESRLSTSSSKTTSLPMETGLNIPVHVDGYEDSLGTAIEYRAVSRDYFDVLGIPILEGRVFEESDEIQNSLVAIVNESFARLYWGPENAVDREIWIGKDLPGLGDERQRRVIGLASDVLEISLDDPAPPIVYVPESQVPDALAKLLNQAFGTSFVLTVPDPETVRYDEVNRVVQQVDPTVAISRLRTLREITEKSLDQEKFYASLAGLFAVIAVLLTAAGVFGVSNNHLGMRIQEFGLRLALGAKRSQIFFMVLGETVRLAGLGLLLGIPAAFALNHVLESLVYQTVEASLLVYGLVGFLLFAVAILAALVPARRATMMDPSALLRQQ